MCFKRATSLVVLVWFALPAASYGLGQEFELRVTGSRVNVRAQPTTSSDVLFQVSRGESLDLVEEVGNWYLVETEEFKRGYIYEQLVELTKLAPGLSSESDLSDSPLSLERTGAVAVTIEEEELSELGPLNEASVEELSKPATALEEAQERSLAQHQKKRGLHKLIGGAAGIATGIAVMGSSKPAGIGLLGAGGYFVWSGYKDKKEGERRLQWGLLVQMDRETKAVAYHMSW